MTLSERGRATTRLFAACAILALASAAVAADADWPTLGRDPGGSRFSPLRQITPANVSRLQPAWTYHLRPQGYVAPAAAAGPPPGPPPAGAAAGQPPGGAFGRSASGFSSSEAIPLVIDGAMYLGTPYGRVVSLDAATGKELWVFELPDRDQPRPGASNSGLAMAGSAQASSSARGAAG
jgi:quinoprotein glucose dehydrogenase